MEKNRTRTAVTIAVVLFFFSIALLIVVFANPTIPTLYGTNGGDLYAIIVDDKTAQTEIEQHVEISVFEEDPELGKVLIDPFSKGETVFYVKNISKYPVKYSVTLTNDCSLLVPIKYRLKTESGEYLIGTEMVWEESGATNVTESLKSGEQAKFSLEWAWKTETDEKDTAIGIEANTPTDYSVLVAVHAKPAGNIVVYPNLSANMDGLALVLALCLIAVILTVTYLAVRPKYYFKPRKK